MSSQIQMKHGKKEANRLADIHKTQKRLTQIAQKSEKTSLNRLLTASRNNKRHHSSGEQ